jgi:hypothetical protein
MKYHFEFVVPNGEASVDLKFPTAPMYIEGDTYNGRCKVWLKYASLPETDAKAFLAVIGNIGCGLELNTPALNRFTLNVDGGTASQRFRNNQQTMARFCMPLNNETIIYDDFDLQYTFGGALIDTNNAGTILGAYPFYQSVETDAAGTIFIRKEMNLVERTYAAGGADGGAVDAAANQPTPFFSLAPTQTPPANNALGIIIERGGVDGTTGANLYPNLHWLDGRNGIFGDLDRRVVMKLSSTRPSDGGDRGVAYCYNNENFNDGNCLIIGSPWGQNITARVYQKSQAANMANNEDPVVMIGVARFEIVIEPMTNDNPVEVGI